MDHRKLGRSAGHRRALLRNMVTSLILHERVETTLPKAKELRRTADRMITLAKEGTLHARRQAAAFVMSDESLRKLFSTLAERFKDRAGGYTRIFRFPHRRGDSAEMATIEYLGFVPPAPKLKAQDQEHDHEHEEETKRKAKAEKKEAKEKKTKEKPTKEKAEKKASSKTSKKTEDKEEKKTGIKGLFGRKKKTEK
ncbi:MAG: 50S ribosomal protein L17 [Deltaproteobacteria bacterium]|nr:MAG: 50S ribosomal protein L17 [Deltaproteobacteria bacterium]